MKTNVIKNIGKDSGNSKIHKTRSWRAWNITCTIRRFKKGSKNIHTNNPAGCKTQSENTEISIQIFGILYTHINGIDQENIPDVTDII